MQVRTQRELERTELEDTKAKKDTEKQSDARANGEAVTLQVQHEKPPFKQ